MLVDAVCKAIKKKLVGSCGNQNDGAEINVSEQNRNSPH
jgi:hypothetical protein